MIGDDVLLTGLTGDQAQYNGKGGEVIGYKAGKYEVDVGGED